jgi:hypothetical protein
MMCHAIDNAASWEICAVICFLHTNNMCTAEIHHELCTIYGQNVMSEGTVRRCRLPQISHTLLYMIIKVSQGYQILCKVGFENTHRWAQNAENGFSFEFYIDISRCWWWTCRIIQVPGNDTWCMLKPTSSPNSGCTHIHQISQKNVWRNVTCPKANGICFLG